MKRIADFIEPNTIQRVLDVGTGDGHFIKTLSDFFPDATFTGIDPSEVAIQNARRGFQESKYFFEPMNAENISFPNESFDLTTISNALHHLASPEKALSEMKRVTRKGGWLVVSEIISDHLNRAQLNQQIYHHHRSKIDRLSGIVHRETYSREEVLDLLKMSHSIPMVTFDYYPQEHPERNPEKLQHWIMKMEQHQTHAEGFPEYDELKAEVELFRKRVITDGFQPATNFVAIIQN